ncbi:MAG: MgtC/SapB family protein [Patescibacteria group bacterium]|nr:MgtC/SapB family protein [Patescibacteria group bacterium]MDE2438457.1 MgtC/SapB family protein [Patescibacteria group bacterium]
MSLSLHEMVIRFMAALLLGAIIGIERELVGKEAGIRTSMLVAGGASIFTIVGLSLPYLLGTSPQNISEILARNSGFLTIIANIVVGVGFLGAGIIIKTEQHVHGLTTAAVIWITAAIGTLVGVGLIEFSVIAAITITVLLYITRGIGITPHATQKD